MLRSRGNQLPRVSEPLSFFLCLKPVSSRTLSFTIASSILSSFLCLSNTERAEAVSLPFHHSGSSSVCVYMYIYIQKRNIWRCLFCSASFPSFSFSHFQRYLTAYGALFCVYLLSFLSFLVSFSHSVCIYIYINIFIYVLVHIHLRTWYICMWKYTVPFFLSFPISFFSFLFIQIFGLSLSLSLSLFFLSPCPSFAHLYISFRRGRTANRPLNTPNTLFLGCLREAFSGFCRLNSDPRNKLAADHGGICLLDNLFPSPRGSGPPLDSPPPRTVRSFVPSFWPPLRLAFVLAAREKGGLPLSAFLLFSDIYTFRSILSPFPPFPSCFIPIMLFFSLPFLFFFIVPSLFLCERMRPISKVQQRTKVYRGIHAGTF